MHADFTSTSELPFASLERVLVLNVSHDFHVHSHDFHANERTGDIYFHTNSFAQRLVLLYKGKSKLGIRLFIRELLREPLILSQSGGVLWHDKEA